MAQNRGEEGRRELRPSRRERASITEQTATHKYTPIHSRSALKAVTAAAAAQCRTRETFAELTYLLPFILWENPFVSLSLSWTNCPRPFENFGQREPSEGEKEEREFFRVTSIYGISFARRISG